MDILQIPPLTLQILAGAGLIFTLRLIGVTVSTIRVLVMMRGGKALSMVLGFFEVLIYVVAIGQVVNNLANIWNILAYCLGFSAGTLVGMGLEERLALGYANVHIFSRFKAKDTAAALHNHGFGATLEWGWGREGRVGMIMTTVRRKEVGEVCSIAENIDPMAFLTIDEARSVRRGILHVTHPKG
jgi:uncharacterized protein YebE (UPF0316 family)